jgi:hypothetical protein
MARQDDQEPDVEDPLAHHPLLAELTTPQQLIVDTVFVRMTDPRNNWPIFDYVDRTLRSKGIDVATELARFPIALNQFNSGANYRHFWVQGGGSALAGSGQIQLTIAGLRQEGSGAGRSFADYLARVVGKLAELESWIVPDPDQEAKATFSLAEVLGKAEGSKKFLPYLKMISSILQREPPIFNCTRLMSSEAQANYVVDLQRDLTTFVGVVDSEDYVRRSLITIGADRPIPVLPVIDTPLGLIDELGYLDAVWQARTQEPPLFGRAKVPSCAGLALPCRSSEEFDARMNSLYDVIDRMDVTLTQAEEDALVAAGRRGTLQRLRARLLRDLPAEDRARIDESIDILRNAVRIRAALHTEAQAELPGCYRSLGLTYPPVDYGTTWDSVRGRASWAIRSIRQALETLP